MTIDSFGQMGTSRTYTLRLPNLEVKNSFLKLSGKRITLIGISFSSEKRAIVEELVEEI